MVVLGGNFGLGRVTWKGLLPLNTCVPCYNFGHSFCHPCRATEGADSNPPSETEEEQEAKSGFASGEPQTDVA